MIPPCVMRRFETIPFGDLVTLGFTLPVERLSGHRIVMESLTEVGAYILWITISVKRACDRLCHRLEYGVTTLS